MLLERINVAIRASRPVAVAEHGEFGRTCGTSLRGLWQPDRNR
jgi:hypothetical protein